MDDNNEYKTYLNIVKHDGYALKDVPVERIDYRICLKSVKQRGSALRYVPEKFNLWTAVTV